MKDQQQITIRMSSELMKRIQDEAEARGYTIKDVILFAIHDYIESQN